MSLPPIALSTFVLRQIPESKFSHYDGLLSDVVGMVRESMDKSDPEPGYRDGVKLVTLLNPKGFYSGIATLQDGDRLVGAYAPRRAGETPRQSISVVGRQKLPAKKVVVVLYRADVLGEDPTHQTLGEWEIISINASPVDGEMPIDPMTLMHNHFGSSGGTATNLSDSEFVAMLRAGFDFWKDKAFVEG